MGENLLQMKKKELAERKKIIFLIRRDAEKEEEKEN